MNQEKQLMTAPELMKLTRKD